MTVRGEPRRRDRLQRPRRRGGVTVGTLGRIDRPERPLQNRIAPVHHRFGTSASTIGAVTRDSGAGQEFFQRLPS